MPKLVSLTIDGKPVEAPEGTLIVDAAKKVGIDIPVFCYHPKMEPVGMCRMCLVEIGRPLRDRETGDWTRNPDGSLKIQFSPKLETACTTPISEGMVVLGMTDKVKAGRKDILEFLLTSHPLDCPICDKGGECPLQNLTMAHGPGGSRFSYDDKAHLGKHVPLGELILLDRERCIQCGRCVRFQDEVVDDPVIGFFQRGRMLEIVTFSEPGFDSYFSGNTTDICPVGALTTVDFRFEARPWEMQPTASICPHCPVGCNITFNVRREARAGGEVVIKRALPRQNEQVNEIWMCDKGRFAYHFAQGKERLTEPLIRKAGGLVPATWDEALDIIALHFREAGRDLLALAGGRLPNEDLYNLRKLVSGLGGRTALHSYMAGGDLVSGVGVGQGTDFAGLGADAIVLVVACDLREEAPVWWLRVKQAVDRGATLIVCNPRSTRLDKYAGRTIRYPYGAEATTILTMVNALSAKRPDLGEKTIKADLLREIEAAAQDFAKAQNAIIIYGSEGVGLEGSLALSQACANLLIVTDHIGRPQNGLIGAWTNANTQGAWDMGFRPSPDLKSDLQSAKAVYIVAADPVGDDPSLAEAIQSPGFLVVQELFLTETGKMADVVLPALSFAEREGTYTNGERRVQRFYPAIPSRLGCLPDFTIAARIGQRLDIALEDRSPMRIMEQISGEMPEYGGISYPLLAEVREQWPIVGGQDLYYGGTAYNNSQGLGVQLLPKAQRGESISLGWVQPSKTLEVENGLWAVPVTKLYDRGQTVQPSKVLYPRIGEPFVVLAPEDAANLGVRHGDRVSISLKEDPAGSLGAGQFEVVAHLDESVPVGIVLVPRSMGVPVWGPSPVAVYLVEKVPA